MQKLLLKFLMLVVAILSATTTYAFDFEVDGLGYFVASHYDMTASCSGVSDGYKPSVVNIPRTVEYKGQTLTVIDVSLNYKDFLESVTIPNSVTSISLNNNYNLKTINLPSNLTTIGYMAFTGCKSLEYIDIPETVTTISQKAFEDCISLKEISLPNTLKKISASAFKGCTSLTSFTIPEDVTTFEGDMFTGCSNLETVTFAGNKVENILYGTFLNCSKLTSITIPSSVVMISYDVFNGCTSLSEVIIDDSPNPLYLKRKTGFIATSDSDSPFLDFWENPITTFYMGRELKFLGEHNDIYDATFYCSDSFNPFKKSNFETLTLGQFVQRAEILPLERFTELKNLFSNSTVPPKIDNIILKPELYEDVIVHIPKGTLSAYKSADTWKNFWNYKEEDNSTICTNVVDESSLPIYYYLLNGLQVSEEPTHGIFFRKQGNRISKILK